jgi:hypothetical protein
LITADYFILCFAFSLRFVQTGIDLSILKFTMMLETEWLERLLGFYTFYFDYEVFQRIFWEFFY